MAVRRISVLAAAFLLAAVLLGAWQLAAQGPVAGDLAAVRLLQSWFGRAGGAAALLAETAKPPYVAGAVLLAAAMTAACGGTRAAPAVLISYAASWGADKALRVLIFSPRPSPDMVDVASAGMSSGLPSTFALVYASLFGVVFFTGGAGLRAVSSKAAAAALIALGLTARAVLGAHWPSQLIASALLGFAFAALSAGVAQAVLRSR